MAIINGTNDPETLFGTAGGDTITGGRGNDTAFMGAGDDRFVWNPGDGSDKVNGDQGFDTLEFNGANVAETINIFDNSGLADFTRNVANIAMETVNVERIEFRALGGMDQITVGDLTHTSVRQVAIDLAGTFGGNVGDGAVDTVIANGSNADDKIGISIDGDVISVNRFHEGITIANAEATDQLLANGLDGNDIISAAGLPASAIHLTLDGGAGDDKIVGGNGDDTLIGGDGNDTVDGNGGNDTAFLGAGDDRFVWNPGDGSDTVEGQAGFDTLQFFGSNAGENMNLFANGGRAELTRDVGNITMDLNGIERVEIHAVGSADTVTVNDLTGTDVRQVAVDLAGTVGGTQADADNDTVVVQGTQAADSIQVATQGKEIMVTGLAATVAVDHAGKNDILTVNALGGDDVIDASKLTPGHVQLQINAGDGNDIITGSAGDDVINGGRGNDTVLAGAGNDRMVWNPGDGSDTIDGQSGSDTLQFNGANINENFNISADGTHVRMTRDVANIAMDLNSVERIELKTLGGADNITIGDLTGTGVKQVALDLGTNVGGGDGAIDNVVANGGHANQHVTMSDAGGGVTVTGLPETLTVANAESTDTLTVNTFEGNDTIDASALHAGAMTLTINAGAGSDVIFGSGGADLIFGGGGNDTVNWQLGGGNDRIDGGTGSDTLGLLGGAGDDAFQIFFNGTDISVTTTDGSVLEVSGMEQIKLAAGAGSDSVTIGDLTGTGVNAVFVDLGAGSKSDVVTIDAAVGEVMFIATNGNHTVITNENTFQTVTLDNLNSTDVLTVVGALGTTVGEVIEASGLTASLHVIGGAGADTIFTGSGNDVIDGHQGNDVALMGAGNDIFNWNPGDGSDSVDGQAGFDTLHFNASNIGENIEILADGSHAELTRNVGAIDMHLNSVERIELSTVGGADHVHVADMTGTGVKEIAIDLAGTSGGPADGVLDTVTVEGSDGNDHVTASSANGIVTIAGLASSVTVAHADSTDLISINGNDGNDTINASGVEDGVGQLAIDGGAGDDTLTGGHGSDKIFGDDGHDILNGGDGADILDGGSGDDVLTGGKGDDTLIGGDGADTFNYTGAVDGHDVIADFSGGQGDRLNLTKLFDNLGVAAGDREGRVSIVDNHDGTVSVSVDADGKAGNGFELNVATLHTHDPVTVGHEVAVNG